MELLLQWWQCAIVDNGATVPSAMGVHIQLLELGVRVHVEGCSAQRHAPRQIEALLSLCWRCFSSHCCMASGETLKMAEH